MYADDQDEDIEEEEEFHEVEEEKHKTSQDAVDDSNSNHAGAHEKATSPDPKTPSNEIGDWANIMLRSQSENSDQLAPAELSATHAARSEGTLDSQDVVRPSDDSIMNDIIKDTQDKLKIVDESCDSIKQNYPRNKNSSNLEMVESVLTEASVADNDQPQHQPDHLDKDEQHSVRDGHDRQSSHLLIEQHERQDSHQNSSERAEQTEKDQPEQINSQNQLQHHDSEASHDVPSEHVSEQQQQESKDPQSQQEPGCPLDPQVSGEDAERKATSSDKNVEGDAELASEEKKSDEVEKKELDLDEDVKNPQYIPKKGVFYEHDDRSHDVEEKKASNTTKKEDAVEAKEANVSKRTSSQDKQAENRRSNRRQRGDADRWNHDLFRGEKQKPKSKSELINAYGYDIRQERGGRSQQSDNRQPRSGNNSNADRPHTSQDGQRSRQSKDGRVQRQAQPSNRSRERRTRRQNVSRGTQQQQPRNDSAQATESKRDMTNTRSSKSDVKDSKDIGDEKIVTTQGAPAAPGTTSRRDQEVPQMSRNPRNDSRGRRKTSRDRPANNEERLPPANTVMPPITTWSNEDMMKAEAFGKKSPPRLQSANATTAASGSANNTAQRDRSSDLWQQSQQNKTIYQDRPARNQDESRQQSYNPRGRFQERGDENHRPSHYLSRNHYHDRSNQNQDWHRANNFSQYAKSNDYIVKTQTFENSRLSQTNMNRSSNNRDLREVINERRMQGQQQNFQNKVHQNVDHHGNQRGPNQGQMYHHHYAQSHIVMHQHQLGHNQQPSPQAHMMQPQQALPQHHRQSQQQQAQRHMQLPTSSQQQVSSQTQPRTSPQAQQVQLQNHRQQPATTQSQAHQGQSRQVVMSNSTSDGSSQDLARVSGAATSSTDPINSRPIIKTDAYTGSMHSHQQTLSQHSQNHRSMSGPMAQQAPAPTTSHMIPSHVGAGAQPQYYTPSPGSRDPTATAAAVATAYQGYMPGGHAVMDATRYHMASQQLADHGYMTTSNQTSDVSGGPVLHQQSMYPDTSTGGAVTNSAFLTQHPGSTISPNTSIPVTGTGPQLPPVSYIQHSQYPPPPYSNPYTQPQHNQGPPQSGHAYPPYWTYI